MPIPRLIGTAGICLLLMGGCSSKPPAPPAAASTEPEKPTFVMFDMHPAAAPNGEEAYLATYSAEGKIARFRIELKVGKEAGAGDAPIHIQAAAGKIRSLPGSDASVLLRHLATALEAKTIPKPGQRAESISFLAAVIGTDMSHAKDGGFFVGPKGNWKAVKIFLAGGEGEVFLNLNPAEGKGEFSMKDPDYGDIVLRELAKVL